LSISERKKEIKRRRKRREQVAHLKNRLAKATKSEQVEITRKLRERREQLARNAAAGIRREADRARDKIKAALAAFQAIPSDRTATAARTEIREVERRVEQVAPAQQTRTRIESVLIQDWSRVAPGDEVVVAPLNARGRLVASPDQRGKVRVQLGAALVTLGCNDVALPATPAQGGSERVTRISGAFEFDLAGEAEQLESSRLDLRGLDAEEALAQTETFLDRAVRAGLRRVTVIHGHGTGVLKSLVRERLSGSPYVREWRPGERGEGGDGVAVVDLGPGDDEPV